MRIGIVGCGFVADNYIATLAGHPGIELVGATDRDPVRLATFTRFHGLRSYESVAALLADDRIQMVVNLTNPSSHFEVSLAALNAGRHVYSEKPLAMTMTDAQTLVETAQAHGLGLAAAPCNHLGEAVQVLLREVRSGRLGRIVLAQAEMDDGMIPMLNYPAWRSRSGAPWPARDEFEVGCVMEHAGYQIGPLVTLFGPVRRVSAFSACLMPEKGQDVGVTIITPDFSIGVLEFDEGIVARISHSILAPANRALRVVGQHGAATLTDVWEYHAPVRVTSTGKGFLQRAMRVVEKRLSRFIPGLLIGHAARPEPARRAAKTAGGHRMDFARGIAQLAAQIEHGVPVLSGPEFALHVLEVTLALQAPAANGGSVTMRTSVG